MDDIIIIGGGISGLYTAYKLKQKYPTAIVKLYEKNNILGGRIHTYNDKDFHIEAGAGRITNKNKLLFLLLQELGLENDIIPINNEFQIINIKDPGVLKKSEVFTYLHTVITNVKESKEVLQNLTFQEYAHMKLKKEEVQYILDFFGYTTEILITNAYDMIKSVKTYFMKDTKYNILNHGLSKIVDVIEHKLDNMNVKIYKKKEVKEVVYKENKFILTINGKKEECKICICAIPKTIINNMYIFQPAYKYLKYIELRPLCRIYAKYKTPWFKGLTKVTTNNPLRYIIPVDEEKGIIMISYTDGNNAMYWKDLYDNQGVNVVKNTIQVFCQQCFDKEIPKPNKIKIFYWTNGVAYFTKGFDSDTMPNKIMHPNEKMPLFACGENYSPSNTGWIEGALDTSEYILSKIPEFMTEQSY